MSTKIISTIEDIKGIDLSKLKAKSIGLSLLIFSNAEREARKINKLNDCIEALEDLIFDKDLFEHLTPQEMMERYKLALQAQQASLNYVKVANDSTNLDDLSTKILLLENQVTTSDVEDTSEENIAETARKLLSKMKQNETRK